MVAMLAALLFSAAFAAAIWSMWITISPRIDYMRALLSGDVASARAPTPLRARISSRPAPRMQPARALRAAA